MSAEILTHFEKEISVCVKWVNQYRFPCTQSENISRQLLKKEKILTDINCTILKYL
jgi:hypothetical protein